MNVGRKRRVDKIGDAAVTYDGQGRVRNVGGSTVKYDGQGKVREIEGEAGGGVTEEAAKP